MLRPMPLLSCVCLALLATACSPAYSSMYKETNSKLNPAPVAAKDVKVVKSREDLSSAWTEIGVYRGRAPTVEEAMNTARQQCGANGANLYVLNTAPFSSESSWKVDGVCGRLGE